MGNDCRLGPVVARRDRIFSGAPGDDELGRDNGGGGVLVYKRILDRGRSDARDLRPGQIR